MTITDILNKGAKIRLLSFLEGEYIKKTGNAVLKYPEEVPYTVDNIIRVFDVIVFNNTVQRIDMDDQAFIDRMNAPAPKYVPSEVTMLQGRLALIEFGIMPSSIDAIITTLPSPQKEKAATAWEYAATVQRHNSWVSELAPIIPLTEAQLDEVFILADTL